MQVRELYDKISGNYEEVLGRLMKEERVVKYLKRLPDQTELQDLQTALDAEDWETAFRAVHTMKGVAANLGLTGLFKASDVLCEVLRPCVKPEQDIDGMVSEIKKNYDIAVEAIKGLD